MSIRDDAIEAGLLARARWASSEDYADERSEMEVVVDAAIPVLLAPLRARADAEVNDARHAEHYHSEVNDGAALTAEQARRHAWEDVVRALDRIEGES